MTTTVVVLLVAASITAYVIFLTSFFRESKRVLLPETPCDPAFDASGFPGVTIFKPCAGADDDLEGCLESFCQLKYEQIQIIFGVRDRSDDAVPVIQRVRARHPELDTKLVFTGAPQHPSPKISNMAEMELEAKHSFYWLSDSNTHVHPDTLTGMMQALLQPGIGMVVSPIAGTGERTLGSTLDNLEIGTWVMMGTYAIHASTGLVAGPGKSCLLHRNTLEQVGSWPLLGRYFGEDTVLMTAIRNVGLKLALGPHLVSHPNRSAKMSNFADRQIRWLQIRWCLYPLSVIGEFLMSPWFVALVGAACVRTIPAFIALGVAALVQWLGDVSVLRTLRGEGLQSSRWWTVLARPLVMFLLALRAVVSSRVRWRGRHAWMGTGSSILSESPWRLRWRTMRRWVSASPALEREAEVPRSKVVSRPDVAVASRESRVF